MRPFLLSILLAIYLAARPQAPYTRTSAEILQDLHKLRVAGTVLYIAAHPDDENTRLLSYLSREKKLQVAYLSLTRGEGGQNLIGNEQGPALGILRTQELLAARRIDGALQYFTRAADFGYSKTPEETFQKWNRDSVLSDIVLVIRKLRPDVIICRFPTTGEGGHGHHTASAILALEAFDAAADKNRFPGQLSSFAAWQSRRIFWNTFNFGGNNTTGPGQFIVDVGGYNPLLGKSYGEIAAESRTMHKSQGFGSVKQRGSAREYFRLMKGDSADTDLLGGIDLSLSHAGDFAPAAKLIEQCISGFDASGPQKSLPLLAQLRSALLAVNSPDPEVQHWKKIRLSEVESLMLDCAGVWLEAGSSRPFGFAGRETRVDVSVLSRAEADVTLSAVVVANQRHDAGQRLQAQTVFTAQYAVSTTSAQAMGGPFWTSQNGQHISTFNASGLAGNMAYPPHLMATFDMEIQGQSISYTRPVQYKKGDPVKGEVYAPYYVLPPADISFSEKVYLFTKGEKKRIRVVVRAFADSVSGHVSLGGTKGWHVAPYDSNFRITHAGGEHTIDLAVESEGEKKGALTAEVVVAGQHFDQTMRWVDYDHIPKQLFTTPAAAVAVMPDFKKGISRVGYINGAGDEVVSSLRQMGYQVDILAPEQLDLRTLRQYQAIVTGIRAFNVNEQLHEKMPVILSYVKEGGNLVVQYNTNSRVGPIKFSPGPYPFTISRQRTTDELAEVKFQVPEHAALNYPNKIVADDFNEWVQERGIYYAEKPDPQYAKLFSMKDPGEGLQDGSTIVASYGKGHYVYTGLAFFRQLPAGVPGAYRLFANLLSIPNSKK
jgi:LmbE family N-acetylglucosaminyl deacetylase